MNARVGMIRGSSLEEIKNKDFNIYLGISLGNKFFNEENLRQYIKWALKYSKSRVGLLVADTLHVVNYEVRNKMKYERALKISIRKGDDFIKMLNNLINELGDDERNRIEIIRWDDVKKDEMYKKIFPIAKSEFENNKEFRAYILNIVKEYSRNSGKIFNDEEIFRLGSYIVDEIPEILNGFIFNGTYYNCYLYPKDSKLTLFIDNLQKGKILPEVAKKLIKRHNVFVELKV